jgi:prepilin-type N-terminal cleavage/methylation domain-containing protein
MQRGFTLVEMSIVLVIIGLILGGLLSQSALIGVAQSKDLIAAVQDMQGAALSFRSKYGFLPGDFPNATKSISGMVAPACTTDGNGNGLVDAAEVQCATDELILAGFIRGQLGTPLFVEGSTISISSAAGAGGFVPATWNNVILISSLNCDLAIQIDRAVDDGNTSTGNFVTSSACAGQNPSTPVASAALKLN